MPDADVGNDAGASLPRYSYAFQPIVDAAAGEVFSYEALIRGPCGEPAGHVFAQVGAEDLHRLDRESRVAALGMAGRLSIACHLNLNMLPRSVHAAEAELRSLADSAERSAA